MPKENRLFVPLKTKFYEAFESGEKTWEIRGVNHRFNKHTVKEGRKVELRRGYSTNDTIWGRIKQVREFDNLQELQNQLDVSKIRPGDKSDFLEEAEDMLGQYEKFIAFEVDLEL